MICIKIEDCGFSFLCIGGRVSFICEEGECVCKVFDVLLILLICNNDDECNGVRFCVIDEGY